MSRLVSVLAGLAAGVWLTIILGEPTLGDILLSLRFTFMGMINLALARARLRFSPRPLQAGAYVKFTRHLDP